MKNFNRYVAASAVAGLLLVIGCTSGTSAAAASSGGGPLRTTHKATGTPYVFGVINDEAGPVTFPEARQGVIAGAAYVNNYLGGINGHPIKIDSCISDDSPAVSARCATQLVGDHVMAILGAADVGSPATIPVYQRANLAYLGGIPFTPVEQNASNAVEFLSVSVGDNAVAAVFVAKTLHAKSVSLLYFDNAQGQTSGLGIVEPVLKNAGVQKVNTVPISPTTPDPSPQVAAAVSANPDVIYVNVPNSCGAVLKDIKALGYTGKIVAIDPCTAPPVLQAAAGGAEGMYFMSPFINEYGTGTQAKIFQAAMKKYAAPDTAVDSIATATFSEVVNVQQALSSIKGTPTTSKILATLKTGSNHPNFLAHPYTCDGKAIPQATSICSNWYLTDQILNNQVVQPSSTKWLTSTGYYHGIK